MNKDIVLKLSKIQKELKAPKGQRNSFGNYNYRSCEDILEAVKPLLGNLIITISDEIVHIPYSSEPKVIEMTDSKGNKYAEIVGGDRFYIKATATITDGESSISNSAFARESQNKKGMDDSQITGAASSYARKYALNGLLLIDDTKDADTQDNSKDKDSKSFRPTTQPLATPSEDSQVCPIHKCVVPMRISKSGNPYWGCTAGEKMHFLQDPNQDEVPGQDNIFINEKEERQNDEVIY